MAKKVAKVCKLQFEAGMAKPGPALASAGINMPQFCSQFNDQTKDRKGDVVPVIITAYEDKSFDFVLKTTPAAFLIKKAAKIQKGGTKGANEIVGTISKEDLRQIAETKLPDLSSYDVDAAMKIIAGTAMNMGVAVKGLNDAEMAEQQKEAEEEAKKEAKREAELAKMEAEAQETHEVEVISEDKESEEVNE